MNKILSDKQIKDIRIFLHQKKNAIPPLKLNLSDIYVQKGISAEELKTWEWNLFEPFDLSKFGFYVSYKEKDNSLSIKLSTILLKVEQSQKKPWGKEVIFYLPAGRFLKIEAKNKIRMSDFNIFHKKDHLPKDGIWEFHRGTWLDIRFKNVSISNFVIVEEDKNTTPSMSPFDSSLKRTSLYFNNISINEVFFSKIILDELSHDIKNSTFEFNNKFSGMKKNKWDYILKNLAHFNFKGNLVLSINKQEDYEIARLIYNHCSDIKKLDSIEWAYTNLLNKYRMLPNTNRTDKLILWLSGIFHGHRTNIFLPIIWLLFIYLILSGMSIWCKTNFIVIFIPGGILGLAKIMGACGSALILIKQILLFSFLVILQIFILYMYYEIIAISRKFIRRLYK